MPLKNKKNKRLQRIAKISNTLNVTLDIVGVLIETSESIMSQTELFNQ